MEVKEVMANHYLMTQTLTLVLLDLCSCEYEHNTYRNKGDNEKQSLAPVTGAGVKPNSDR